MIVRVFKSFSNLSEADIETPNLPKFAPRERMTIFILEGRKNYLLK